MCELCQTFEKEQVTAEPRKVPVLPQWNGRVTDEQCNVGRYSIYVRIIKSIYQSLSANNRSVSGTSLVWLAPLIPL